VRGVDIVAKPCGLAAQYGVAFGSCWAGTVMTGSDGMLASG
jgi:hypothetical protein